MNAVNAANEEVQNLERARDVAKQASDQWITDTQDERRKTEKAQERIASCQTEMVEVMASQTRLKGIHSNTIYMRIESVLIWL